jgi:hypothetical protein
VVGGERGGEEGHGSDFEDHGEGGEPAGGSVGQARDDRASATALRMNSGPIQRTA